MKDTIQHFIQTAARVFKRFYGVYPSRMGLDYFTRLKEFGALHYVDTYGWVEPRGGIRTIEYASFPDALAPITMERVWIKIEPALFEPLRYTAHTNMLIQQAKGRDEVLCAWDEISVHMSLWFTEHGYHAIVWDGLERPYVGS